MKDPFLNRNAEQMLHAYESLGNIESSPEWEQSLKIQYQAGSFKSTHVPSKPGYALTILILIIFNAWFFLAIMIWDFRQPFRCNEKLQVISNEFMINPTSLKN
jgi:hypothetical protein